MSVGGEGKSDPSENQKQPPPDSAEYWRAEDFKTGLTEIRYTPGQARLDMINELVTLLASPDQGLTSRTAADSWF